MSKFNLILIATLLMFSCSEGNQGQENEQTDDSPVTITNPKDVSKADRISEIESLEQELKAGGDQPEQGLARKLMGAYMDFGNFQHHEAEAPEYLYRAADLARYIGRPKKAIELYTNVFNSYTTYPKRVEALNWIAFIYDYDLEDKQKAKENYALLISSFPEHPLADDARARLETIDLSDDELIELFRKKNQVQ